jgi:hypothetical protein
MDEQLGNRLSPISAIVRTSLGEIVAHEGRVTEANEILSETLKLEQQLGDEADFPMTWTLSALGHVLLAKKKAAEALTLLRRAKTLQDQIGDRDAGRLALTGFGLGRAMVETRTEVRLGEKMAADACGMAARSGYRRIQREVLDWAAGLPAADRRRIATTCSKPG